MSNQIIPSLESITPEAEAIKKMAIDRLGLLKAKRTSLREARDMFTDALLKNEDYVSADKLAKEAIKKRKEAKERALQNPEVGALKETVKDVQTEVKETQLSFSEYLLAFEEKSGKKELVIDTLNPEESTFEIVKTAKVKRKEDPNKKWGHR